MRAKITAKSVSDAALGCSYFLPHSYLELSRWVLDGEDKVDKRHLGLYIISRRIGSFTTMPFQE